MSDLEITPAQAHYVLSRMVSDRKVTRRDVSSYLAMMQSEIDRLEERLETLRSLSAGEPGATSRATRRRSKRKVTAIQANPPKKAKAKITAEQKASRKLQGTYMSLLRRFPKNKRGSYQRLVKEKGRQAAVDAMKADLGVK